MSISTLSERELLMILIDGSYLYELGKSIQPLHEINKDTSWFHAWLSSLSAVKPLEEFLTQSVYVRSIRLLVEPAEELLKSLSRFEEKGGLGVDTEKSKEPISWEFSSFQKALINFEAIFRAEFRHGNMFLVTPKGGFELRALIQSGEVLFPVSLPLKAPDAMHDIKEGAKCLAFEVYTASGFHLHRANESVLKSYYKNLTGNEFLETERNMGKYIKRLEDAKAPKHITSCLRDLKDMHRNPLMHPDQSIENMDDAIALLNAIHNSINGMLKEIPDPEFNMEQPPN